MICGSLPLARTDIGVAARTAITHAQFESIHPFTDGNGRTGRTIMLGMLAAAPAGSNRATLNRSFSPPARILSDTARLSAWQLGNQS